MKKKPKIMAVVAGKSHTLCAFRVEEVNEDGTPRLLRRLGDDETVDLTDGGSMQFVTGFLPTKVLQPKAKSS